MEMTDNNKNNNKNYQKNKKKIVKIMISYNYSNNKKSKFYNKCQHLSRKKKEFLILTTKL